MVSLRSISLSIEISHNKDVLHTWFKDEQIIMYLILSKLVGISSHPHAFLGTGDLIMSSVSCVTVDLSSIFQKELLKDSTNNTLEYLSYYHSYFTTIIIIIDIFCSNIKRKCSFHAFALVCALLVGLLSLYKTFSSVLLCQ